MSFLLLQIINGVTLGVQNYHLSGWSTTEICKKVLDKQFVSSILKATFYLYENVVR